VKKRLKLFMYGPAGVGKTTAAIQFPHAYIIDCERGTDQYDKKISDSGGVVYQTSDMSEIIAEVKSLLTEKHQYRTLVIDPITTAYNDLLEKCELRVGSEFGRHFGEANKQMKRLANLIMALDMNVVVTAHAKTEYGDKLQKLGFTFDGWKQLDYWFDLVIELSREKKKSGKRFAEVIKSRLEKAFPDRDVFDWSYAEIQKRYDIGELERDTQVLELATPQQVADLKKLLELVKLPEGTTEKWLSKANVETWEDMPADTIAKCLEYVRNRVPSVGAA
jgi:KaiC/GvpD/RAD55 family RecA-like ATPase